MRDGKGFRLKQASIDMREKIVTESTRLFLGKGFEGTSIQEISDAVEATKGAIYWYFKGKNEILETILDIFESTYLDSMIRTVEQVEGNFLDKFIMYHNYSTEFARDHKELCVVFATVTAEMVGSGKDFENRINRIFERYHTFLCSLIEEGKREGVVRNEIETAILADVIIGIHNGELLQWYMKPNIDGIKFSRAFRSVLMYGMLKDGTEIKKQRLGEKKTRKKIR